MSLFTSIDLSKLPPPAIVEELDYETLLAATKNELQGIAPELDVSNLPESDPISKLLEVMAYRELHLRQRINEAARGVMLATAAGADLDNLAALVNIIRLQTDPGDPDASPPVPPEYEDDERLRTRTQLAFEGFSTAGPEGAYIFHALSASALVKDVAVYSESPGVVDVRILSTEDDGTASDELLESVETVLNSEKIRPITDQVVVQSAYIVSYSVDATLVLFPGVGAQEVVESARAAAQAFVDIHHGLGVDITRAGLFSALYQPGVQNVDLHVPAEDILIERDEAPYCVLVSINYVEHPTAAPCNLAGGIIFSNTATNVGEIEGTVMITPAAEEYDITHYVLYWAANNAEKLPSGAKNYTFSGDTLTLDHSNIENLLITSNDGKTIYLEDKDYSVEGGTITATNAAIEDTTVRVSYKVLPIAEIAKDSTLSYGFTANTLIPADATHLIVFTKNEFGEMRQGVSVLIDG